MSAVEDVEQMELSYPGSKSVNGYNTFGKLNCLLEVIMTIAYDPTITFFGIKST